MPKEKFLLVGNHRSAMDPVIEMGVLRKYNPGFIAKKELFEIPVIGRVMHMAFCIPLDRGNLRKEVQSISKAAKLIKSQVAVMGIYPEGMRNEGKRLLPLKNGAFKIAQKARCPIVVAVIRNSENIMKNAPFRKTKVQLEFVGVLETDYIKNNSSERIGEAVKSMLEGALNK